MQKIENKAKVSSTEKFDFKNKNGITLSGRLDLPQGEPRAFAIFAHCFTCSKNINAAARISNSLRQQGIAILRFDFTGLGDSEGDFADTNFTSNLDDLRFAYHALKERYEAPQILIGHSLGGAAVLRIAEELEMVKAVATIAAPSNLSHILKLFKDDLNTIESKGEASVILGGREFKIKEQFIKDLSEKDYLAQIQQNKSKKSYLIFHSPTDEIVSIEHAAKIYTALRQPKSFIALDNADHLISNPADSVYIANLVSAWAGRYLSTAPSLKIETEKNSEINSDVQVSSREGHLFTQDIMSKDHHLVADEPITLKGDNLGMNPYELLLSSLGACTAMTVRMYADRKGIKLSKVKVELSHEKKYETDDLDKSETSENLESKERSQTAKNLSQPEKLIKRDYISKKITLTGELTDEEKLKLLSIAERCPVNLTLQSKVIIK